MQLCTIWHFAASCMPNMSVMSAGTRTLHARLPRIMDVSVYCFDASNRILDMYHHAHAQFHPTLRAESKHLWPHDMFLACWCWAKRIILVICPSFIHHPSRILHPGQTRRVQKFFALRNMDLARVSSYFSHLLRQSQCQT